jgi:hypothetical protein
MVCPTAVRGINEQTTVRSFVALVMSRQPSSQSLPPAFRVQSGGHAWRPNVFFLGGAFLIADVEVGHPVPRDDEPRWVILFV